MKISIHTMYFLPDFGSAPILMNELATGLAAKGLPVEVVTTIPRQRPQDLKGLLYSHRRLNGFEVKRFWTNAAPHPLGRLLAWNIYEAGTILNTMTAQKGDVLFLRTPPLQLGLTGYIAKKLKKARVLLNVQDIHPDLSIESGILKNPTAIKFAQALEKWVYRISDHIVVISEGFKQNLLAKGVDSKKLSVIPNWVDTDFLKPLSKDNPVSRKYGLSSRFVLMYSGTISISSNMALERILETAKLLESAEDVHLAIVGEGLKKEGLQKKAADLGLKNVSFIPFQPYKDLPDLLASSDVLLVPLDKEKSQLSVPSKLYNFMAAGRPIFGLATPDSEVAAIIRDTQCGVSAAPDKSAEIASGILTLRNSPDKCRAMALNARRHVVANFAKPRILSQYEEIIKNIPA